MLRATAHRGPDGLGVSGFDGGAFGMVRLALVDLSDRGMQPIWSPDRQVAIVFNGEMYNHAEERARLEAKGHRFVSTSDTEVVLALYLESGARFVDRIRGMFALALIDLRERRGGVPRLVLARDPFGIKPLYLARTAGGAWVFASELAAIRATGLVPLSVSDDGLRDFLTFGFVLQPRTIFAGVEMVEPGTLIELDAGAPPRSQRFWLMPPPSSRLESMDEAAARLRATLEQSVRLHAMADTPVGAFLSGGIDSSITVGLMSQHNAKLRTYTVRLTDPDLDESAHAREFARSLGCVHTEVEVSNSDVAQLLPTFAASLDQPSTDGLNTWVVSRAAARDVKGVVSGLGGDEWFGGYPVVQRMAGLERQRALVGAARLARRLPSALPRRWETLRTRLEARASPVAMWCAAHRVFAPTELGSVRSSSASAEQLLEGALGGRLTDGGAVDTACQLDVWAYMGCQLLRDSDVTSMASSLELRVPLVDREVAAVARSIRPELKLDATATPPGKRVLIEAAKGLLPPDATSRPKRGFALPYSKWLDGPLRGLAAEAIDSLKRRQLVQRLPDRLNPTQTWALMVFELWLSAWQASATQGNGSQAA